MQDEVLALVNAERARAGVPPLMRAANLDSMATEWSMNQARQSYMHHSSTTTWGARLGSWQAWGENVAYGYETAQKVMTAWMNSSGHRANILKSTYTSIGIGVAYGSSGTPYWTQQFARYSLQNFTSAPAPTISLPSTGKLEGGTLTARTQPWSPAPTQSSLQWFVGGVPVPGATGTSYTMRSIDVGRPITVVQTGSKDGFITAEAGSAPVTPQTRREVGRTTGNDRFETSVEVSRSAFAGPVSTVFVATGLNFPDALAAAPAAIIEGSPVLLVARDMIPPRVSEELIRLSPERIVILGADPSVSTGVQTALGSYAPDVVRWTGADRFGTSRQIALESFESAPTVYLATGNGYADALSAATFAGSRNAPVLLVNGGASGLDSATADALRTLGTTEVVIVGGTPSVSSGIQSDLSRLVSVRRVTGTDRWGTSVALAADSVTDSPTVFLATGLNYPDALTGSVLSASRGSALMISPGWCVPNAVIARMDAMGTDSVTLLGGTPSLDDNVKRLASCGW